ncbi:SGNH/GDSL hydrolase family protein [Tamlana agarivorans]|uniref:SGNH/GDSL hydrolase family protein n=1 Tax=Pseudotamlana agarivorans TaxID=481183 RepID=A0ACC5U951_9FLAO|nr:SGNH/GDSL hydrolase family protein [Tamlana agarivorans]MBU2950868.1 SGNH/GDSL hydrolase family protein [Tamlana agarivorans]
MNRRSSFKLIGALGLALFVPVRMLGSVINTSCEACAHAWKNLSKFNATRYPFRYLEPTQGLPKVFIYGDSISIGYTEYVRASLKGKADVMRLHINGNSSAEFIKRIEAFRKALFQPFLKEGWSFSWDVIHFNVGLHDLKYLYNRKLNKEKGEQVSSLEDYEANLKNIIKYLKATYPTAKLIFATTTPVPEGEEGRVQGDAVKYNKVAMKVMQNHPDIIINDLHTFSKPVLEQYAEGPGNVHYNATGSRLQGIQVAKMIGQALDIEPNDCPSVDVIIAKFKAYESKITKQ